MKKIVLFTIAFVWFFLLLVTVNLGNAVELEVKSGRVIYDAENLDVSFLYEVRAKHKNLFLFGQQESTMNRFGGQECADITVSGFGVGVEKIIDSNFKAFLKVGYYTPETELRPPHIEAIYYGFWEALGTHMHWDRYEYQLEPNVGAEVGVEYIYPVTNGLSVGISGSYRFLKLEQALYGRSDDFDFPYWEVYKHKNFNASIVMFSVSYKF